MVPQTKCLLGRSGDPSSGSPGRTGTWIYNCTHLSKSHHANGRMGGGDMRIPTSSRVKRPGEVKAQQQETLPENKMGRESPHPRLPSDLYIRATLSHKSTHVHANLLTCTLQHTHRDTHQFPAGFQHGLLGEMCGRGVFVPSMGCRAPWCRPGKGSLPAHRGTEIQGRGLRKAGIIKKRRGSQKTGTQLRWGL